MADPKLDTDQLELYKLEYARCLTRYEDIYRAIWTQFNYFLLASGALLAFGKGNFSNEVLTVLALLPLIFWYWATFEPMNGYADKAALRASELERILNKAVFALPHGAGDQLNKERLEPRHGLWHFQDFCARRATASLKEKVERSEGETEPVQKAGGATESVPERPPEERARSGSSKRCWWMLGPGLCLWLASTFLLCTYKISLTFLPEGPKMLADGGVITLMLSLAFGASGAILVVLGTFGERIRSGGVRSAVRLAAAGLHLVLLGVVALFLFKVGLGLHFGPKKEGSEIAVERKGAGFIIKVPKEWSRKGLP